MLPVGIGCLEFQKGMAGMDSSNKHVPQISFGTASHFANMTWAAERLATVAKSSICTNVHWFAEVTQDN